MCFSDPVDDSHSAPLPPWLLYLADQRPKHRSHYDRNGRYGTDVRMAGNGWRGRDDPRFRPRDEAFAAAVEGRGAGGEGNVYPPPGPRQGGGGGGDGGRVRVPPGVNAGRGGGGSQRGGSVHEPVVRDFGAEGGGGGEVAQAPGMGFDAHTVGTATVIPDSSSGAESGAAGATGAAGGGSRRGGGGSRSGVGRGPAPSVAGSTHSRHTHRSGGGRGEGAGGGGSRHGSVNGGGEGSRHGSVGRGRDGSRHGSDRPMTYQSGGLSVSMGGDRIVLETRDGPGRILESVIEMGGRRRGRDRCYDSDSDSDIDSWD